MKNKMSVMGVGGKIAIVLVISFAILFGINYIFSPTFEITSNYDNLVNIGIIMTVVGFALNLVAAFGMLKAYKKEELATKGLYSIFLNPMYTLQIFITVPGLLLLFNSWIVLITIIPLFIAFKIFAKEEEKYLEEKFGNKYREYKKEVVFKYL